MKRDTDGPQSSFAPASRAVALLALAVLPVGISACGDNGSSAQNSQGSIRDFGSELTGTEARQAAAVLRAYLDARAERRWTRACSYLAEPIRRLLELATARSKRLPGTDCSDLIASATRKLPAPERAALDRVTVDSVRADGDRGYVLYQAPGDGERAMPIRAEGGSWKLVGLSGTPLAAS